VTTDPAAFRAFEADAWNKLPAPYEAFFGPLTARAIDPALAALELRPGARLLDVASGPGHVAGRAAQRGAVATGVDVAPAMVARAAATYPQARFVLAAAEELPFDAASFDAVTCAFGLGHFAEPQRVVTELARVMTPGGRLALAWWDEPDRTRLLGVFHDALACVAAPPPALPDGPPFFRYSSAPAIAQLLAGAGLVPEPVQQLSFVHRVASKQALWDGVLSASVRTAAAVRSQPPDIRRRIRDAFDALVAPYATDTGIDIPVSILIGAGSGPGRGRTS
jgi:SAM-dependent methyltransferase